MIKIQTGVFDKADNSILKFLWKAKSFRIGKLFKKLKKNAECEISNVKTYCKGKSHCPAVSM